LGVFFTVTPKFQGTLFFRIYLGTRVHNKFLTLDLFIRVNLNPKPRQTIQNSLSQVGCGRVR